MPRICGSALPCVALAYPSSAPRRRSPGAGRRSRSRRDRGVANCCASRRLRAVSESNCQRASRRFARRIAGVAGEVFGSRISAGCRRSSVAGRAAADFGDAESRPAARLSQASPPLLSLARAARAAGCRAFRRAAPESVRVPGVTMRITLRSTGPLRGGGVADLFADRDRLAQLDQLGQILLGGVVGHARHLDRAAGRWRRAW